MDHDPDMDQLHGVEIDTVSYESMKDDMDDLPDVNLGDYEGKNLSF